MTHDICVFVIAGGCSGAGHYGAIWNAAVCRTTWSAPLHDRGQSTGVRCGARGHDMVTSCVQHPAAARAAPGAPPPPPARVLHGAPPPPSTSTLPQSAPAAPVPPPPPATTPAATATTLHPQSSTSSTGQYLCSILEFSLVLASLLDSITYT